MKTGSISRGKQILSGLLIGLGVWTAGVLFSGLLPFIIDIRLFRTGPLPFLFPPLVCAVCVAAALIAARRSAPHLLRTVLIAVYLPVAAYFINIHLDYAFCVNGLSSTPADHIRIPFVLLGIPAAPAIAGFIDPLTDCFFDIDLSGIAYAAFLLPMLAGLAAAIVIYVKRKDKF